MNFNTVGGRRYALVWAVLLSANVLLWQGKLTSADYVLLMAATVAAYITGNVAQRRVESQQAQP